MRFRGLLGTAVAFVSGLYLPSSEQRHTKALGCVLYSQGFPGRQPASLGWLTEPEMTRHSLLCHLGGSRLGTPGCISVALQASSAWNQRRAAVSGFPRVVQTRVEATSRTLGYKTRQVRFLLPQRELNKRPESQPYSPAFPRCSGTEWECPHLDKTTSYFGSRCSFPLL